MAYDSTLTPTKLGRGVIATSPTVTTVYTVPVLTRTFVTTIDLSNTSTAAITATVYLVESGGSPGAANTLVPGISIPAGGVLQWTGVQVLNAGDSIRATGSASGLTINVSGGEAT